MAMASGVFGLTLRDQFDASQLGVDLVSDVVKFQLVSNTYTPDFTVHGTELDITNEISGTGYTSGGVALSGKTLAAAAGTLTFDASDVSLSNTTLTGVRGAVLFDDTQASDVLVSATTFGADYNTVNGTFAIAWNASGIFYIDYTP